MLELKLRPLKNGLLGPRQLTPLDIPNLIWARAQAKGPTLSYHPNPRKIGMSWGPGREKGGLQTAVIPI